MTAMTSMSHQRMMRMTSRPMFDVEEASLDPSHATMWLLLTSCDQAPSGGGDKSFGLMSLRHTYSSTCICVTARISIPALVPHQYGRCSVDSFSPPLPPIPSPSLPVSPPLPVSSPVPVASPLHLLSTDRREDRPEVTLPPRKRLGIALGPAYEVGESSSAAARPAGGLRADYGFVATMDREIRRDPERDVGYGITIVGIGIAHARTARLMETKARMSREAWGRSMDASDLARAEVMSLRTTVLAQQSQIRELQSADRRRQTVITEMLAADHRRQKQLTEALKLIKRLQTQMQRSRYSRARQRNGTKKSTRGQHCPIKTNTTSVTNAQLQAMINQGVTTALAARDANTNGVDSHNSGTGARRNERATRESHTQTS
ncbi:hypothetical protein Tco_0561807 [Tanacetum coccineum]